MTLVAEGPIVTCLIIRRMMSTSSWNLSRREPELSSMKIKSNGGADILHRAEIKIGTHL